MITPPPLGVGLLEFHQLDLMVEAGRMAARALLEEAGGDRRATSSRRRRRVPDPTPTGSGRGRLTVRRRGVVQGHAARDDPTVRERSWDHSPIASRAASVRAGEWWKSTMVPLGSPSPA